MKFEHTLDVMNKNHFDLQTYIINILTRLEQSLKFAFHYIGDIKNLGNLP